VFRRTVRSSLAVLAAGAMVAIAAVAASGASAPGGFNAGPPYRFTTELMGEGRFIPLKDQALVQKTKHGYRFRTGQQDSHLVVTMVRQGRGIRLVDTGTQRFLRMPDACRRQRARVGVALVCPVPGAVTVRRPLLLEVWPRLGADFTDGSSLPASVAMTVLGDEGRDFVRLGAGPDFVNGAYGNDRISSGAGNDWIRGGRHNDTIVSGPGTDYIVSQSGLDDIRSGDGNDKVFGGEDNDRVQGDAGDDFLSCGTGQDRVLTDQQDSTVRDCEAITRR
jgi:serralysin